MKLVEVRRNISAPAEKIWEVITNPKLLTESNLGILKIDGEIKHNGKIKLWSEVSPKRAFSLQVKRFNPHEHMTWIGGMPFGLFTGQRDFMITSNGHESELYVKEEFSGLLTGVICKSMPDLQPSFNKFADGVKLIVEGS